MSKTPVEELEAQTGTAKANDETVREYVERIGQESDVDSAVIEDALTYITEWHYSNTPPEDEIAFRRLIADAGVSADFGGSKSDPDSLEQPTTEDDQRERPARDVVTPAGQHQEPTVADPTQPPDPESRQERNKTDADEKTGPELSTDGRETGTTHSGFKSGIEGKEPRKLALRFLAVVGTAPVIGWMVARAWVPGNALYDQSRAVLVEILGLSGPRAIDLVAVFILGLYIALLALFLVDVKKRVQGVLLLVGTGLALTAVALAGVFFPALEYTVLNGLSLVLGLVAGLVMESSQLLSLDVHESTFQRPTLETGAVPEFRNASLLLFGLVSLFVAATLVQVILAGTVQVYDALASALFLGVLYQFIQYESETNYMTLGPERSGKSMLMLGLCLELIRTAETYPNPNSYLQQGLERASNLQPGNEQWPIPSTSLDEVRAASFEVIAGYYFPRRLELTALDYAGQHLGRVADLFDAGRSADDSDVPRQVADQVSDTDTLFFLLDVERLVFPGAFQEADVTDVDGISWGLEHYATILENVDADDVIIVATKCDILVDQSIVEPPATHDSFTMFRDAVTDHLLTRPDVRELLEMTGTATIHPVYFSTQARDGEYVPQLDADGNLVPVGYDHLLTAIRSRQ